MKTSVLKSKLREMALKEMPEVIDKIDLNQINILPKDEKKPRILWNLRRIMTYTFTFLFVGVISLGGYTLFIQGPTTSTPLESETEILAFQAISASSLLTELEATPLSYDATPYALDTTTVLEDDFDLINQYLNMMETVLGDQDTMLTQNLESDKPEYQYYILYRNADCLGNLIEYKFYYNASQVDGLTEIIGMLYHEENSYQITARFSGDSINNMVSFKAALDEQHYVLVEDQSTADSQSYKYMHYVDNQLQNEATISIQMKKGNLKASIDTRGRAHLLLNIERVKGSTSDSFSINYAASYAGTTEEGDLEVKIGYEASNQSSFYEYMINSNGMQSTMMGNRENKGNTKATDDDFEPMGNHGGRGSITTTIFTTSQTQPTTSITTATSNQNSTTQNSNTTTSNMGSNPH